MLCGVQCRFLWSASFSGFSVPLRSGKAIHTKSTCGSASTLVHKHLEIRVSHHVTRGPLSITVLRSDSLWMTWLDMRDERTMFLLVADIKRSSRTAQRKPCHPQASGTTNWSRNRNIMTEITSAIHVSTL